MKNIESHYKTIYYKIILLRTETIILFYKVQAYETTINIPIQICFIHLYTSLHISSRVKSIHCLQRYILSPRMMCRSTIRQQWRPLLPIQTITFVYWHLIAGLREKWKMPDTCIHTHTYVYIHTSRANRSMTEYACLSRCIYIPSLTDSRIQTREYSPM